MSILNDVNQQGHFMNKTVRNVSIAAGIAVLVGFIFGLLSAATRSRDLASAGQMLAAVLSIFSFFILQLRGGNRRTTYADANARAEALTFACPTDRALVYIIRTGFAGKAVGVDITVDGRMSAQIKSPRFACLSLVPGEHHIAAQVGDAKSKLNPDSAQFVATLAAGSIALLHVGIQRDLLRAKLVFEPWTLEMAKAKLRKVPMVLAETSTPAPRPAFQGKT
jgi:hypothetical protein